MNDDEEMTDAEFVAALAEATTKALDAQRVAHATELDAVRVELEAEIAAVRLELTETVRAMPIPGVDDLKALEQVLRQEMARVEFRATPGKDGRGVEAATVGEGMLVLRYTDGIEQIVGRVMGEPGADGKDAVLDVEALAKEVVTLVPLPKDGKDGEKGDPGTDGKDAVLDMDTLALEVASLVPLPKDGKDGEKGKDAEPVDRVTLAKDVLALIPVPRDGKDGIASMDDLRSEVAKAVDASVGPLVQKEVAETVTALPTLQYRGVFREGTTYKAGECVTWAGSMWHADSETKEKPGEGETAWTMMVKKGDKGRDLTR